MLKRIIICLLALLLCVPALAEECVELPGVTVTYTPPERFCVLTRESSASEFNALGQSQRELVAWMMQHDTYAVMYDLETGSELLLYAAPAQGESLDDMSGEELEQLCTTWIREYELHGYEEVTAVIRESENGRFLQYAYKTWQAEGFPCYVMTLGAFRQGCYVQLSLFTYGEPPAEELINLVLTVADGLCLTPVEEVPVG